MRNTGPASQMGAELSQLCSPLADSAGHPRYHPHNDTLRWLEQGQIAVVRKSESILHVQYDPAGGAEYTYGIGDDGGCLSIKIQNNKGPQRPPCYSHLSLPPLLAFVNHNASDPICQQVQHHLCHPPLHELRAKVSVPFVLMAIETQSRRFYSGNAV